MIPFAIITFKTLWGEIDDAATSIMASCRKEQGRWTKPLTDMIHIKPITRRQNQLSVHKVMNVILVELIGFEPMVLELWARCLNQLGQSSIKRCENISTVQTLDGSSWIWTNVDDLADHCLNLLTIEVTVLTASQRHWSHIMDLNHGSFGYEPNAFGQLS